MGEEVDAGFQKKKKIIIISIAVCVVLFILVLVMMIYFYILDANGLKVTINKDVYKITTVTVDGTDIQKGTITFNKKNYDLYCIKDGQYYFNINSISEIFGYEYKKGEYSPANESSDKCYIINEGEYVSYCVGSNVIKKQFYENGEKNHSSNSGDVLKDNNIEYYTVDNEIIRIENSLYGSADAISIGFNMQIEQDKNMLSLYGLSYLTEVYGEYATSNGYDGVSLEFKNKRALVNGMIVVEEKNKYGVYSLVDKSEVISTKYDSLEYVENINQFIATYSGNVGILSPESEEPTIDIQYDSIELIDVEDMLYLVSENNKYGIISGNGKPIVPIEYETIGFKNIGKFSEQVIENQYIFFDKLIAVYLDGKYGFYSKNGDLIRETVYDDLGCLIEDEKNGIKFLKTLIVEIPIGENIKQGVVVKLEDKYGVIGGDGEMLISTYWDAISLYKDSNSGEYKYAVISDDPVQQKWEAKPAENYLNY